MEFLFLSGGFPTQASTYQESIPSDSLGNTVFKNENYTFYATFPALNLKSVVSNVPVLGIIYGFISGG